MPGTLRLSGLTLVGAILLSAGACSVSSNFSVSVSPTTVKDDGTHVTVTVSAKDSTGKAMTGSVAFTADKGAFTAASATLDASGTATTDWFCSVVSDPNCLGTATITAKSGGSTATASVTLTSILLPDGGLPEDAGVTTTPGPDGGVTAGPPSIIIETEAVPAVLGLKGSGIQEQGEMTFLVTDSAGIPAPGATVTFGEATPALVTLAATTGKSGADGTVKAEYASGTEVGTTTISATLANGAVATHPVTVRGAKPSASGFYFRCDTANLGAYNTVNGFDSTTCTVRLSDRYGNRVGIPTPISFASEAGSIPASVTTKAFDPANPDSPDEGTATVTFTTASGNGFKPLDVAPLAADAAQVPFPRAAEPQQAHSGGVINNPRDQFVTLIAMVRGEEAFIDANHNGVLDGNEVFIDQGDPFVDANDNGAYDPDTEVRFCGGVGATTDCTTYHAPNGAWDSDKIIWQPTWVVFTGFGMSVSTANLGCIDYTDNTSAHVSSKTFNVFALDPWLNTPVAGTAFVAPKLNPAITGVTVTGSYPSIATELDNWGAMGFLGYDFDYVPLLASDNTKPCAQGSSGPTACIQKLLFGTFRDGSRGFVTVLDGNKLPTALAGSGAGCPAASAGTQAAPYDVDVSETMTKGGSFQTGATGTAAF